MKREYQLVGPIYRESRRLFQQIPKQELSSTVKNSSIVKEAILFFNKINVAIQSEILTQPSLQKRVAAIEYWAEIASQLYEYGDFSTPKAILAALTQNTPIFRLKKTQAHVPEQTQRLLQELEQKLESSNIRRQTELRDSKVIPYLGLYLRDVITINEIGSPNKNTKIETLVTNLTKMQNKLSSASLPKSNDNTILFDLLLKPEKGSLLAGIESSDGAELALFEKSKEVEPKDFSISASDFYNPSLRKIITEKRLHISENAAIKDLASVNQASITKISDRKLSRYLKNLGLNIENSEVKDINKENRQTIYRRHIESPKLRALLYGRHLQAGFGSSTTKGIQALNKLLSESSPTSLQVGKALKAIGVTLSEKEINELINDSCNRFFQHANAGKLVEFSDYEKIFVWTKYENIFKNEFLPLLEAFKNLAKKSIKREHIDFTIAQNLFEMLAQKTNQLQNLSIKIAKANENSIVLPEIEAVRRNLIALESADHLKFANNMVNFVGGINTGFEELANKFGFKHEELHDFINKVKNYVPSESIAETTQLHSDESGFSVSEETVSQASSRESYSSNTEESSHLDPQPTQVQVSPPSSESAQTALELPQPGAQRSSSSTITSFAAVTFVTAAAGLSAFYAPSLFHITHIAAATKGVFGFVGGTIGGTITAFGTGLLAVRGLFRRRKASQSTVDDEEPKTPSHSPG